MFHLSGQQLKKNLKKAWKLSKSQRKSVNQLTNALDPTVANSWNAMLGAYYHDPSRPNLFEESAPSKTLLLPSLPALNTKVGVTFNDLKDELKKLDGSLKKSGTLYPHETMPSQFILQALEVEDQQ